MNGKIASIDAMEILNSRGNPTLRVFVELRGGVRASASVPSGASTGAHEALELRDGDPKRFGGKGVQHAAANVIDIIAPKLIGFAATHQREIDGFLIDLDGTKDKSRSEHQCYSGSFDGGRSRGGQLSWELALQLLGRH